MSKVRINSSSISADGYGAGPALGYDVVEHAASESALHVVLAKASSTT